MHIFNTVGSFPYECSIHPSMTGEIIVQPALDISDPQTSHLPNNYQLQQNYPNPFNPETAIEYYLATNSHVTITVYNILGQEISRLLDKVMAPGNYVVFWDGRGANGIPVGSGIYFYRMDAGDFRETRRMILLR